MLQNAVCWQLLPSNPVRRVSPTETKKPKDICGDKWIDSNKLFIQDDGKPMQSDSIGKWFKLYIEELGLPIIQLS